MLSCSCIGRTVSASYTAAASGFTLTYPPSSVPVNTRTLKRSAETSLASHGMISPSPTIIRSPGTRQRASARKSSPPRITLSLGCEYPDIDSMRLCEITEKTIPTERLTSITIPAPTAMPVLPNTAAINTTPIRIRSIGSARTAFTHPKNDLVPTKKKEFPPVFLRRERAAFRSRPEAAFVFNSAATSSIPRVYHFLPIAVTYNLLQARRHGRLSSPV